MSTEGIWGLIQSPLRSTERLPFASMGFGFNGCDQQILLCFIPHPHGNSLNQLLKPKRVTVASLYWVNGLAQHKGALKAPDPGKGGFPWCRNSRRELQWQKTTLESSGIGDRAGGGRSTPGVGSQNCSDSTQCYSTLGSPGKLCHLDSPDQE